MGILLELLITGLAIVCFILVLSPVITGADIVVTSLRTTTAISPTEFS